MRSITSDTSSILNIWSVRWTDTFSIWVNIRIWTSYTLFTISIPEVWIEALNTLFSSPVWFLWSTAASSSFRVKYLIRRTSLTRVCWLNIVRSLWANTFLGIYVKDQVIWTTQTLVAFFIIKSSFLASMTSSINQKWCLFWTIFTSSVLSIVELVFSTNYTSSNWYIKIITFRTLANF